MPSPSAPSALQVALLCWSLCVAASAPAAEPRGRLLRVPKVYNALITSDEPLLPSRTEQATVGQVLYYPPHPHHATYPASSGPLVLPQVAAQVPPLYNPNQPALPGAVPQPLVSVTQADVAAREDAPAPPPLELSLQGAGQQGALGPATGYGLGPGLGPHDEQQQVTPWPVVYASDVQQQQDDGQPEHGVVDSERQPPAPFPAARAVQTVERVDHPGQYQPPPAVDIDSVKNNRPADAGIPDVPPPPLPVGRGRKAPHQQPPPPGLLPF